MERGKRKGTQEGRRRAHRTFRERMPRSANQESIGLRPEPMSVCMVRTLSSNFVLKPALSSTPLSVRNTRAPPSKSLWPPTYLVKE
eukprot:scaffold585_cov237-Pinguiococcus_pyrenoidosus.AAC.11